MFRALHPITSQGASSDYENSQEVKMSASNPNKAVNEPPEVSKLHITQEPPH